MGENLRYIVIEMQTNGEGVVATLTNAFDNLDAAYNKYYTVLAYAAISTLPRHAASLMTNDGMLYESKYFDHVILKED